MHVTMNGVRKDVPVGMTLGALIDSDYRHRAGIAVAVNDCVIPRSQWDGQIVHNGDFLAVVAAVQGG